MVSFTCNICGTSNQVENFATEPASCACGSNVRMRAMIYLLSMELFGQSLTLKDFPKLKAIRGLGMTDQKCYAEILEDKFDYTNTYYDRHPRFDFTESHPQLSGSYDFILSADVLEHVAPPVERALEEVCQLLKPHGFFAATVYCNRGDQLREHFPELHEYRILQLGNSPVLVNRKCDGSLEIREDLIFHGGSGSTLEMREFGITELEANLLTAGFRQVHFLTGNLSEIGILFDHDVSQPFIARKAPFAMGPAALSQFVDLWHAAQDLWRGAQEETSRERERSDLLAAEILLAEESCRNERERADLLGTQIRLAAESRWLRLGRKLGLGPKFQG